MQAWFRPYLDASAYVRTGSVGIIDSWTPTCPLGPARLDTLATLRRRAKRILPLRLRAALPVHHASAPARAAVRTLWAMSRCGHPLPSLDVMHLAGQAHHRCLRRGRSLGAATGRVSNERRTTAQVLCSVLPASTSCAVGGDLSASPSVGSYRTTGRDVVTDDRLVLATCK